MTAPALLFPNIGKTTDHRNLRVARIGNNRLTGLIFFRALERISEEATGLPLHPRLVAVSDKHLIIGEHIGNAVGSVSAVIGGPIAIIASQPYIHQMIPETIIVANCQRQIGAGNQSVVVF